MLNIFLMKKPWKDSIPANSNPQQRFKKKNMTTNCPCSKLTKIIPTNLAIKPRKKHQFTAWNEEQHSSNCKKLKLKENTIIKWFPSANVHFFFYYFLFYFCSEEQSIYSIQSIFTQFILVKVLLVWNIKLCLFDHFIFESKDFYLFNLKGTLFKIL